MRLYCDTDGRIGQSTYSVNASISLLMHIIIVFNGASCAVYWIAIISFDVRMSEIIIQGIKFSMKFSVLVNG